MPESIIFDSGIFVVTVALWAARTLRVAKRLVSWHFSRCAAKQCGCQILEAAGPGSKPRPSCSLIRSRAVLLNSNSLLERPGRLPGEASGPASSNTSRSYLPMEQTIVYIDIDVAKAHLDVAWQKRLRRFDNDKAGRATLVKWI